MRLLLELLLLLLLLLVRYHRATGIEPVREGAQWWSVLHLPLGLDGRVFVLHLHFVFGVVLRVVLCLAALALKVCEEPNTKSGLCQSASFPLEQACKNMSKTGRAADHRSANAGIHSVRRACGPRAHHPSTTIPGRHSGCAPRRHWRDSRTWRAAVETKKGEPFRTNELIRRRPGLYCWHLARSWRLEAEWTDLN